MSNLQLTSLGYRPLQGSAEILYHEWLIRVFFKHRRSENYLVTTLNSPASVRWPRAVFYSDVQPLSKYSPVTLHLSPATRILNESPCRFANKFKGKFETDLR